MEYLALGKNSSLTDFTADSISVFIESSDGVPSKSRRIVGDFFVAKLSVPEILILLNNGSGVRWIGSAQREYRLTNNVGVKDVNAPLVWGGASPLPTGYTGNGVIIGIIDSGIDYEHLDFASYNGGTRIAYIWDQKDKYGPAPVGFGYGTESSRYDINQSLDISERGGEGYVRHRDSIGHGTHVAGIAAGNSLIYRGVAPEATIIAVALNFGSDSLTTGQYLVDAVKYIYDTASKLGMPVVINASLSMVFGIPDGNSIEERIIESFLNERHGRAFVASAGNKGAEEDAVHCGINFMTSDTVYTYLNNRKRYYDNTGKMKFYERFHSYIDSQIGFSPDTLLFFGNRSNISKLQPMWFSVKQLADSGISRIHFPGVGWVTISAKMQRYGVVDIYGEISEPLLFDTNIGEYVGKYWRILFSGGRYDLWIADRKNAYPAKDEGVRYIPFDSFYSVRAPASSDLVVAVGAYTNRSGMPTAENGYVDFCDYIYSPFTVSDIAYFSSKGPTADGRMKPDITAPGEFVVSCLSSDKDITFLYERFFVAQGGNHILASGTSMSSPFVAGAVALYLERYPEATASQILVALRNSAVSDEHAFNLPNFQWGYGKLDVFSFFNEGGISTSEKERSQVDDWQLLQNYPNPFLDATTVEYHIALQSRVELSVFNTLGQLVIELVPGEVHDPGLYKISWNASSQPSGLYIYVLTVNDKVVSSRKMLLVR